MTLWDFLFQPEAIVAGAFWCVIVAAFLSCALLKSDWISKKKEINDGQHGTMD